MRWRKVYHYVLFTLQTKSISILTGHKASNRIQTDISRISHTKNRCTEDFSNVYILHNQEKSPLSVHTSKYKHGLPYSIINHKVHVTPHIQVYIRANIAYQTSMLYIFMFQLLYVIVIVLTYRNKRQKFQLG